VIKISRLFYKKYKESNTLFDAFIKSEEGKEIFSEKNYEDGKLIKVVYYDSFSNEGIKKLIKKIHKLNNDECEIKYIDTSYVLKRKQFIAFQETFRSVGIFADIKFKKDEFIDSIHISWCQRSNYNAMFEFEIRFKKQFANFQEEYDFIKKQLNRKTSRTLKYYYEYIPNAISYNGKNRKYEYIKLHNRLLNFSIQTLLTETLYTENGNYEKLYSMQIYKVDENILKEYDAPYMGIMAERKDSKAKLIMDFIPSRSHPTSTVSILTTYDGFDNRNILSLFSEYRNLLYYNVYFDYELNKLNQNIAPYNIGVIKRYSFKKLRWMFRKLAELKSSRDNIDSKNEKRLNKEILKDWDVYYGTFEGEQKKDIKLDKLVEKSNVKFILEKYQEQYELYKIALETQNSQRNLRIAVTSLVLAIIAILISIAFPYIFTG
jgi:hypothetical protein